jgi:hypothetical protein
MNENPTCRAPRSHANFGRTPRQIRRPRSLYPPAICTPRQEGGHSRDPAPPGEGFGDGWRAFPGCAGRTNSMYEEEVVTATCEGRDSFGRVGEMLAIGVRRIERVPRPNEKRGEPSYHPCPGEALPAVRMTPSVHGHRRCAPNSRWSRLQVLDRASWCLRCSLKPDRAGPAPEPAHSRCNNRVAHNDREYIS